MTVNHEVRYRTLFERAPVGILYADAQSTYLDANACICAMLGYARDELVGLHATDIVAADEVAHIDTALADIQTPDGHRREWRFRRKDGSTFLGDVVATTFPDGTLLAMIRDVTEARTREREVARLSRLYAALSHVNQAIVWAPKADQLFHRVCEAMVEHGGFRMAWIAWQDSETRRLRPVASCGDDDGYLAALEISTDERPEGRGPTATAFRTGRAYVCNDLRQDERLAPWRDRLDRHGFRSSAALPIAVGGTTRGTLNVYAGQPDVFHDREVALLTEAAADLSFALDNFAREDARREAERIARDEQQFTETMFESMPGVVYVYDAAGHFRRWNRNFESVTGYSADEIATMHPLDFFSGDDRALVEQRIAEVFEGGEASVDAAFVARGGQRTFYHFTGRRVQFEGQTCLIGVGVDITARKAAEAARARQASAEAARARAEAADRLKSAFLATMSHELRTPLNSIIGFTGVLLQGLPGPLTGEQQKQLEMVRTSARHLLALVNDVLDISKIEAGQIEMAHAPFEARRSITKVVDLTAPAAARAGLALRLTLGPDVPVLIADERRFEQILFNLVGNAVKFTGRGGEVRVVADLVPAPSPGADPAVPPWLRVQVIDTGIGIRAEDLPTLFQPFRQVDSGLSRQYEGTGLGLAISARLAQLMGGHITADSRWGEGSTFVVTLPLEARAR
ncbi:PAS domain S-box protein [Luteitalea sp.]